jgi:hypothetical protein
LDINYNKKTPVNGKNVKENTADAEQQIINRLVESHRRSPASKEKLSTTYTPRVQDIIRELFKHKNYYSESEFKELVRDFVVKCSQRSESQLEDMKVANTTQLRKAGDIVEQLIKKLGSKLVAQSALNQLITVKVKARKEVERLQVERAKLLAKQDAERRQLQAKRDKVKRDRDESRDQMFGLSPKRSCSSSEDSDNGVHVRFNENLDEYDYTDGFCVPDHESEGDIDSEDEENKHNAGEESKRDDLDALSDALTDLDVGGKVEELDEGDDEAQDGADNNAGADPSGDK